MYENPYKGIPEFIQSCMEALLLDNLDDYHYTHERRYARTIQVILDQNPQGKLLELGTSDLLPLSLKTLAPELKVSVTDFDLEKPLVWQKEIEMGLAKETYTAYSLDLEKTALPVEDETYDYVVCCEVLEHMEIDPMFMLSEVNRVLKDGGTLILTTPNVVSSRGLTKVLAGIEPYFYMQYQKTGSGYHRHNYEYSIHTVVSILKAAGFDGSTWTEDTFEEPITSTVETLKAAGFKIDHTGDNIFVVAKKIGPVVERYPKAIYV